MLNHNIINFKRPRLNLFLMLFLILVVNACQGQKEIEPVECENYVFSTEDLARYRFPTHINDIVMDRSEAKFSEVFIVVIEPEKAPPLHKHDDTEQIFYVTEGGGTLTIGKEPARNMVVSLGDVVRIPVGAWHSIKADQGDTLKYLAIDCFGGIRNQDEPTWDSHVKVLCKEQGWDYETVLEK